MNKQKDITMCVALFSYAYGLDKLHNDNRTPQEMAFNKLMLKIQNPELLLKKQI